MDRELATHAAEVLKAVAHPLRLQIVEALQDGEKSVGQIVDALAEKQAVTSQQLTMMKDRGVLACRREGAKVFYRIQNPNIIRVLACVYDHCEPGKPP
ncbi:MAG TPA: metalloregulator ArsR/SmtB family transcription factor [Sedimentisphaerales bacterium]|nr:metalloregulator ArsR/SmtB family transcription factor [Sedimentisphaerales bacterium]